MVIEELKWWSLSSIVCHLILLFKMKLFSWGTFISFNPSWGITSQLEANTVAVPNMVIEALIGGWG